MPGQKKSAALATDERHLARAAAADEASELISQMRADLELIASFLATEQDAVTRRGLSTKRLARLRLMADDLASAHKFAAKSIKS
jgi:hypothetical protein